MEICFSDAPLCAVFNTYDLLRDRYGDEVAHKLAIRMSVLASVPVLSAVPSTPPFELCPDADASTYTVKVGARHRLRFRPIDGRPKISPNPDTVTKIEVIHMVIPAPRKLQRLHG